MLTRRSHIILIFFVRLGAGNLFTEKNNNRTNFNNKFYFSIIKINRFSNYMTNKNCNSMWLDNGFMVDGLDWIGIEVKYMEHPFYYLILQVKINNIQC